VALSVLDEHIAQAAGGPASKPWERSKRRQQGRPNYRLVRYADDWCLMISGTSSDAQAPRGQIAEALSTMGLRLSPEKTLITHIDEGLDFLGFRIQRHQKKGAVKRYVYTYPCRAALAAVKAKVRTLTQGNTHLPLAVLLHRLNQVLRGWTTYFRHAASAKTFACLGAFTWRRVWLWLRHKHRRSSWKELRRLYAPSGVPAQGKASLFNPATVSIIRYRYRGADIPSPWTWPDREAAACPVA
jgi:RNA-directed DNA polymerase